MTRYGHRKTYKVTAIDRKLTPLTCVFDSDRGKQLSMVEYFFKTYDIKITDTT
jgi:hypothetical protein